MTSALLAAGAVRLVCPVRGCAGPLVPDGAGLGCPAGHGFDLARQGYVNLLQPQDRKAAAPGDSPAAVAARQRSLARGDGAALGAALGDLVGAEARVRRLRLLDVGCGAGAVLGFLLRHHDIEGWGVDLSKAGIAAAARAEPRGRFVVANADRQLPFAAGSFDVLLSVLSRKNPAEFHRILAPTGWLVVVVPAEDDLAELRAAVLGPTTAKDRTAPTLAAFAAQFAAGTVQTVRARLRRDPDALRDLLLASYRGARHREAARAAALEPLDVTVSWHVLTFRPLPAPAPAQPAPA